MEFINLKEYRLDSLKNLEKIISSLENKGYILDGYKDFINSTKFQKEVLFIGGSQISGSLSPFIHTFSSFLNKSKEFFYVLLDMTKEDLNVGNILDYIEKQDNILGCNVTMPYKIDVFELLKKEGKLDITALLVGAVNTISKKGGKIIGYNTDIDGIIGPIKSKLSDSELKEIQTGYILGAGGAARACISAMLIMGITDIFVFNRKECDGLTKHFNNSQIKKILKENYGIEKDINIKFIKYDVINGNKISNFINKEGILINTLPFGFKQDLPKKPIIDGEIELIKTNIGLFFDVVYDMNYGDTPIIQDFKNLGIKICDGRDMLIGQAVRGYNLWTNGKKIDIDLLKMYLKKSTKNSLLNSLPGKGKETANSKQ